MFWGVVLAAGVVWAGDLIVAGEDWLYFEGLVAPSDPPDAWKEPTFVPSGWETGPSGFGFGDDDDATPLDMQDHYTAVYIRKEFTVSGLAPDAEVQLVIDYDDGFIAYINGDKVAQEHVTIDAAGKRTASLHEAGTPQVIPLGKVADVLDEGLNVIAIEGHNATLGSTDFSLIPALRTVGDMVLTEDTTWSGTVLLNDNVVVDEGVVLNVAAGTTVAMNNRVAIKVYGQLLAEGTAEEPIRFTRSAPGVRWDQILFVEADDSRLINCIIEFADSGGDHKDYYDNDCDAGTPFPSRAYHEAVTAVATHLDIEGCTFQKLPDDAVGGEGDAIAIISDDPDRPGEASARIIACRFLSIGQGIHTRFAYVLIEDCFFTGHEGDNDDIDLYGESTPPPMVRNNVLLSPGHDDMINPTRCSAIIVGNIIGNCDDHGIVLRDKCAPIVMNNVIFNCSSAGIAVQNQCDALLINNTIYDCGRGVRFFDHTGRWGAPYCLFPGSGKATLVNCIIRACPTSFELTDSPWTGDRGSHAAVSYCNVEGGQSRASVSASSTLTWGEGNIDVDPLFANAVGEDFHLKSQAGRWDAAGAAWVVDTVTSPCIDAGDPGDADWMVELWPHGGRINMGAYGGTPQASMSISATGNVADLDHDDVVGIADLMRFADDWPIVALLLDTDLNRDGKVNLADYAVIARYWSELP
jgi:parallel beta-helix repeat protein